MSFELLAVYLYVGGLLVLACSLILWSAVRCVAARWCRP
jgi:hypothetical protein